MVRTPTAIQTSNNQNGDPRDFAIPAGVRKIPTAMHSPATAAVAEARPSCRARATSLDEPIEIVLVGTRESFPTIHEKPREYSNALDRAILQKIFVGMLYELCACARSAPVPARFGEPFQITCRKKGVARKSGPSKLVAWAVSRAKCREQPWLSLRARSPECRLPCAWQHRVSWHSKERR